MTRFHTDDQIKKTLAAVLGMKPEEITLQTPVPRRSPDGIA